MNSIEMAQYVLEEFMHIKNKKVIFIRFEDPVTAHIVCSDGNEYTTIGKVTVDLKHAKL